MRIELHHCIQITHAQNVYPTRALSSSACSLNSIGHLVSYLWCFNLVAFDPHCFVYGWVFDRH